MRNRSVASLLGGLLAVGALTGCSSTGGKADGGRKPTDGGGMTLPDGGMGGGSASGNAPELENAQAFQTGRQGDELLLEATLKDSDGDARSVRATFLDSGGAPMNFFDSNGDGTVDAAEGPIPFGVSTQKSISVTAKWTQVPLGRRPSKIRLEAKDAAGQSSTQVEAVVHEQTLKQLGEACDKTLRLDRCAPGEGCKGTPSVCSEGSAPSVVRASYIQVDVAAAVLVEGLDEDWDGEKVKVEFLDAQGMSVALDLDNDGTPDSSSLVVNQVQQLGGGKFFARMDATETFRAAVKQVQVVAIDSAKRESMGKRASLGSAPTKSGGATCDPLGFDACVGGTVCDPGVPNVANVCTAAASVRGVQCQQAPVLEPQSGKSTVTLNAAGASLWDPPTVCSTSQKGRPEGVVMLKVNSTATISLSTQNPGTSFDTVLYVMKSCTDTTVVDCNDDVGMSSQSKLTLTSMAPGLYLVVIDSWTSEGGAIELTASVQ